MMRGQATPIQSVPSETILRSSTTDKPSNKLPSYLQSLHQIRPARPSLVSSELGSDVRSDLSVKPNTWKLPDLSSLHNVGRTRDGPKPVAKLLFLQKTKPSPLISTPNRIVQEQSIWWSDRAMIAMAAEASAHESLKGH